MRSFLRASYSFTHVEASYGITLGLVHENSKKMCVFYLNLRGHTIEVCSHLKARISNLIDTEKIPHMWVRIPSLPMNSRIPMS